MGSLSQKEFARRLGIPSSTLWQYLHGRIPPADLIALVCERFSVSERWLLTGEGVIFEKDAHIPAEPLGTQTSLSGEAQIEPGVLEALQENPVIQKLVLAIKDMDEEDQREILRHSEKEKLLKQLMMERREDKAG